MVKLERTGKGSHPIGDHGELFYDNMRLRGIGAYLFDHGIINRASYVDHFKSTQH